MGATYLSMQLRTTDRDATLSALEAIATAHAGAGLQSYVAEPGRADCVFDFPTVLSAAIPAYNGLGTLAVDAPADLFVFDLQEGEFEFVDNDRAVRKGRLKIVPRAVVASGRVAR